MKKIIVILFIITIIYMVNSNEDIIIPSDAVRFRIIANSNSFEDQNIKKIIKNDLITNVFPNIKEKEDIPKNIDRIKQLISNYNIDYKINYGKNYFPEKTYKGIKYPEGNYESLVITLENGMGDNYWCVMYPSLCLIEENDTNEVQYRLIIKDIIKSYKNNVN